MYRNPIDFTSLRTNIATLRAKFKSTDNLDILDIVESDLAILETWWAEIDAFDAINGSDNPLDPATVENFQIDKFEQAIGVVVECVKAIDARIETKSNRDVWGDLFTAWLTLSNNMIVDIADVTDNKFTINDSILHQAKDEGQENYTVDDPAAKVEFFYPIYSFRDMGELKLSIEVLYDRFLDLGTQIAHSLYRGTSGYDAGKGKYEAFLDWKRVIGTTRESTNLKDKPTVTKASKLMEQLWIVEDASSQPTIINMMELLQVFCNAVSKYDILVDSFNLMSQTMVKYFSTPMLRWADENQSETSQSIKMLNEAQEMRNETFDYYEKWIIGTGRTFLELCKHVVHK